MSGEPLDLDAIEAEWKGIPGPYSVDYVCGDPECAHVHDCECERNVCRIAFDDDCTIIPIATIAQHDNGVDLLLARAFAAAPQHLRDLIAENRAQRAEIERLRELLELRTEALRANAELVVERATEQLERAQAALCMVVSLVNAPVQKEGAR